MEEEVDTTAPKTKQRKKRSKPIDPNAPKRPANAFILFCELQREFIKEERRLIQKRDAGSEHDVSLMNLTKALGVRWRELTQEDNLQYRNMYEEAVRQYDAELRDYLAQHPDPANQETSRPDLNRPKRPVNSFFLFCEMENERLRTEPRIDRSEEEEMEDLRKVSQPLSQRWRNLTIPEREGDSFPYSSI